jgi:hypothetical protein
VQSSAGGDAFPLLSVTRMRQTPPAISPETSNVSCSATPPTPFHSAREKTFTGGKNNTLAINFRDTPARKPQLKSTQVFSLCPSTYLPSFPFLFWAHSTQ